MVGVVDPGIDVSGVVSTVPDEASPLPFDQSVHSSFLVLFLVFTL